MRHGYSNIIRHILTVSICLALAASVAGCLPSTSEGPDRLFPLADETDIIRHAVQEPDLFNQSSEYRNSYVLSRMYAVDLQYYKYEASLTHERQDLGFAADLVNIGLTGAVPLVAAKATKDVLGAAASGLTGIKNAYNDDILLNRTIQILQSQMRANRAQLAAEIILKLKRPASIYPLPLALSDLEDYYRAGTVSGALLAVNSTVSAEAEAAQDDKSAAIIGTVRTIITNPNVPLAQINRGAPVRQRGDLPLSPAESLLRVDQIRQIERLVCAPVDGRMGPVGSVTRARIAAFLKKKDPTRTSVTDALTLNDRDTLLDAITANEQPSC